MIVTGADPARDSESSEFSSSSDIVGTPGVVPFTWEDEPGLPKGPAEMIFESVLARAVSRRESLREAASSRAPPLEIVEQLALESTSSSSGDEDSGPDAQIMKLNLRASLMGVHILDDETEMFFSRQLSNASSTPNSNGTPFRNTPGRVPFKWEMEPGRPLEEHQRPEPRLGPLLPPPGSRPVSGVLYPGQFGLGQDSTHYHQYTTTSGPHLSENLLKKLVGQSRMSNTTTTMQVDGLTIRRKRGESSTETLDRHFGHYGYDLKYEDSSSPTSTLDHNDSESSPSSSERYFASRTRRLKGPASSTTPVTTRPSSQLAQCLLSLTAMADDTTDEDDIIFEQPSTSTPLISWQPPLPPAEPHGDWPIVQYVNTQPTKPQHRHPQTTNSPARTHERWSSNSSSWNLSLLQKPGKLTVTGNVVTTRTSGKPPSGQSSRYHHHHVAAHGPIQLREVHHVAGPSSSAVLTYDRSGDIYGRHKWERDSSGSLPSVDELGFEAYDRPEEVVHTVDEEDFPFSPIASSFVFGERNNSVEFSQRGGRSGIPKAVGPIVQEFSSAHYDMPEYRDSISKTSDESLTYSLEGIIQDQQWIPTKSFHYIKGQGVEIVEIGNSSRVFNGYLEINHSGRFSIDLQRGPRLERHRNRGLGIDKTPEVLLRIVKEASELNEKKRQNAKYGCFSQCKCLPVPKKGFLGRCLTSNQRPRLAVANSFEARLGSRSLGSVSEKHPRGPFQFF